MKQTWKAGAFSLSVMKNSCDVLNETAIDAGGLSSPRSERCFASTASLRSISLRLGDDFWDELMMLLERSRSESAPLRYLFGTPPAR